MQPRIKPPIRSPHLISNLHTVDRRFHEPHLIRYNFHPLAFVFTLIVAASDEHGPDVIRFGSDVSGVADDGVRVVAGEDSWVVDVEVCSVGFKGASGVFEECAPGVGF